MMCTLVEKQLLKNTLTADLGNIVVTVSTSDQIRLVMSDDTIESVKQPTATVTTIIDQNPSSSLVFMML